LSITSFRFAVFLLGLAGLAPCMAQADNLLVESASNETTSAFTEEEVQLLELTNKERAAHKNLKPLKMNKILTDVARSQSSSMASRRHLSHTVKGRDFACRIKESGYPVAKAGENVARSIDAADFMGDAMKMWMKSPAHRNNILNPCFTEIGIGIAQTSGGDSRYFTQIFGSPKIKKAEKAN